ncbi:cullin-9-like [Rana temporaria]|uniref:cullin-9-like n=1 Tax=Rana temporaria TaxID=8407 RepID=UPI001AAC6D58|nr:cullin-9-like [Rana temporaria]
MMAPCFSGSRAHVLLALSQQDGIEEHMDFESRFTLLQLFAETTSSEEHCISFDGVHLPQIPGKQLFSLVKRYLCVTSMMDQLSSDRPDGGVTSMMDQLSSDRPDGGETSMMDQLSGDRPDGGVTSMMDQLSGDRPDGGETSMMDQLSGDRPDGGVTSMMDQLSGDRPDGGETSMMDQLSGERPDGGETSPLQRHFDFSMAMGSLICELVRVMGWAAETPSRGWRGNGTKSSIYRKVFPSCRRISRRKHGLKVRSDFSRRGDYTEYLERVLLPGMSVRMVEDCEPLKAGDEGVFLQSLTGLPAEVDWHRLGHTRPVQWFMLEVVKHRGYIMESDEKVKPVPGHVITESVIPALSSDGTSSHPDKNCATIRREDWWEILFFIQQLEEEPQRRVMEMIGGSLEKGRLPPVQMSVSVDVAQEMLAIIVKNCHGHLLCDLQTSHVYNQFYGKAKSHDTAGVCDHASPTSPTPSISQVGTGQGVDAGSSDLQTLNTLLMLEGMMELSEKTGGLSSDHDTEIKRSLESCRVLAPGVRHVGLEHDWKFADRNVIQEGARGASGNSDLSSEKMVGMLVELLTSQMKDKLLVVTSLQLTYLVMSKYDWRVLFATEGGVRAVLGCMQEHRLSAAVQHIGLAVLKVLTGADGSDSQGQSRHNTTLSPGDAQVIKEIFSSIGSAASGSSSSLLRAIPNAITKMISVEGCFSSVYNGLLLLRMLMENHKGLSEQLSSMEFSSVLQSFLEEPCSSMDEPQRHLLSLLLHCSPQITGSTPGLAVQEMDLSSLLSALKDIRMCREMLPSLERCVCEDVSSLRCNVPQLLTDFSFFLQLLSCLEQLGDEKRLQLCVYRILNKALHLYEEDVLPWHKSISPSLRILEASGGDRELFQEVVRFLYSLAVASKDCAMVMSGLRAGDILSKTLDKQSSDELTSKLRDLLTTCETYTAVHHKMAACVVAGCMQVQVLFLSTALSSTKAEQKEEKCWEKMDVSSNPHRVSRLTDGNPKSYWESSGSLGSHSITIHMQRGAVIRQLAMVVSSEDSSYMPSRVVVMGGENQSHVNTELNAVTIASTAGRILLLDGVTRFWPIIQIKIKRCQQGGIDTRVRGLEILGPKPTFWPVFKEQLCRRAFLFYTSRGRSWGQEICDNKENLLQLFSRLEKTLSQEEEFIDRFLPDDEAAQAVGRMCREALISPLVQSITTSDPGGTSPLHWLLTRYLENSQSGLSTFDSRVRRLTRLLVQVDTAPPGTTGLKPPNNTSGENGGSSSGTVSASCCGVGSMVGMAECWQGVVEQQVRHFLEERWKEEDPVPEFCSMYAAYRGALEEMFAQREPFLLALQQGFCRGVSHLPSPTALHVMERFARYIDRQIIAVRSDSSDFQSMEKLQQFLEFVLFLSDLEMCNSFEHFYRHYLAERLLTFGLCWLENFVVDRIGICFPNQFPQQMLKNLQEAKDLQREEHLYWLKEEDTELLSEEEGMVTMEDGGGTDWMEDGGGTDWMEDGGGTDWMEDGGGTEDGFDVEVSLLSAQCWPFSDHLFMYDPQKYFSSSLALPLLRFTTFFRKCPALPGSSLHWTWLGKAELRYGDLTLRVSTLQMFILLNFNQQEEISEEEIRNRSGVSGGVLRSSLEPLTAKTGILAIREETGSLYLDTSVLCDEGAGPVLTLIPTRGKGAPDISSLEEKRRFILELVDQVMREERYVHIDALVVKVIGASRKRTDTPPFTCATDVLCCIMCRLRDGAIYRKTDNPLILGCKEESPPSPPPLSPLLSHDEPVMPIPPQVSEFCSVRKITNNIGAASEERPMFRTFRYPE